MKRWMAATAAVGCLVALPASASAKKYQAYAGNPGKAPKSAPAGTQLNHFFPGKLKIHQGDTVKYTVGGVHTVSLLGKGKAAPGLIVPDPAGGEYAGITDPTGAPSFFYNGLGKFIYSTDVFTSYGDANVTKNDPGENSGLLFPGPKPTAATLKFSAKGTVKVLCLLHPGMTQTVRVLPKKANGADTAPKVAVRVVKESRKGYQNAKKAAAQNIPAGTVYAGVEKKNATVLSFLPGNATVPVGGTLTFKNRAPSEVHNMVFIGTRNGAKATAEDYADAHQQQTDIFPFTGQGNQAMPDLIYGSVPNQGAYNYAGDEYGVGYLQTSLIAPAGAPGPLAKSEAVTFTRAATYHYYCAIHGKSMAGTVTVQ